MQRRQDGKIKEGKAPTLDSVNQQISAICSAQFVGKILKAEVTRVPRGLDLTFRTNQATLDALCRTQFGKSILFTDNHGWTDSKTQVHAFYCLLALLLTSLLQRELARKGESISINRMLEELGAIRETLIVSPRRPGDKKFPSATCLTRISALQQRLFSHFDLQRFRRVSTRLRHQET